MFCTYSRGVNLGLFYGISMTLCSFCGLTFCLFGWYCFWLLGTKMVRFSQSLGLSCSCAVPYIWAYSWNKVKREEIEKNTENSPTFFFPHPNTLYSWQLPWNHLLMIKEVWRFLEIASDHETCPPYSYESSLPLFRELALPCHHHPPTFSLCTIFLLIKSFARLRA